MKVNNMRQSHLHKRETRGIESSTKFHIDPTCNHFRDVITVTSKFLYHEVFPESVRYVAEKFTKFRFSLNE